MPPIANVADDSQSMNIHAEVPSKEAANLIGAVTGFADKASKQSDRWWLSVLMLIGIATLGTMLYWFRTDRTQMIELFSTTLKSNTTALDRMSFQYDRIEKELAKRSP